MTKKRATRRSASGPAALESARRGPLDPVIAKRARAIAAGYTVYVAPNDKATEKGWYLARVLELPLAFANGRNPEEALNKLHTVLETVVGAMLERGESPPEPGGSNRTEQVNIRLTPGEKMRFERAAQSAGFRSISDYIRAAALRG